MNNNFKQKWKALNDDGHMIKTHPKKAATFFVLMNGIKTEYEPN